MNWRRFGSGSIDQTKEGDDFFRIHIEQHDLRIG